LAQLKAYLRKDTEEIIEAKPKQPLTEEEVGGQPISLHHMVRIRLYLIVTLLWPYIQKILEEIERRLQTLQLSLELLSNICIEDTEGIRKYFHNIHTSYF